jgi:hypothetical protein
MLVGCSEKCGETLRQQKRLPTLNKKRASEPRTSKKSNVGARVRPRRMLRVAQITQGLERCKLKRQCMKAFWIHSNTSQFVFIRSMRRPKKQMSDPFRRLLSSSPMQKILLNVCFLRTILAHHITLPRTVISRFSNQSRLVMVSNKHDSRMMHTTKSPLNMDTVYSFLFHCRARSVRHSRLGPHCFNTFWP